MSQNSVMEVLIKNYHKWLRAGEIQNLVGISKSATNANLRVLRNDGEIEVIMMQSPHKRGGFIMYYRIKQEENNGR